MSDFNSQSCVKCGKPSVFIPIQTTSLALCNDCYAESIRFKFRTTLAKTRLFPKGFNPTQTTPKVLVLFEWDSRARVMLQLINETNNQSDSKKRFTSYPTVYVVHTGRTKTSDEIKEFDGLPINHIHLSAIVNGNLTSSEDQVLAEKLKVYNSILDVASSKSIECELKRLMLDMLAWRLASSLDLSVVMMTDNSELIAQKSMTALWFGRSTSVTEISGILDERHATIKLLRPFRNITNVELEVLAGSDEKFELSTFDDSLSSKFLDNVKANGFPSIVNTVLSVATKLDVGHSLDKLNGLSITDERRRCQWCQKVALDRLCEPCQRLMSQIKEDRQQFILNALCPV